MVKKINSSEFEQVKNNKAIIVDLAREYRIMNIPAVIAIKGGQVAGQQIGLVSKDDMKGFIDGVF